MTARERSASKRGQAGGSAGADIMLRHAAFMSRRLGRAEGFELVNAYVQRLEARSAFKVGISA